MLFLASPLASYISGHTLEVSPGAHAPVVGLEHRALDRTCSIDLPLSCYPPFSFFFFPFPRRSSCQVAGGRGI